MALWQLRKEASDSSVTISEKTKAEDMQIETDDEETEKFMEDDSSDSSSSDGSSTEPEPVNLTPSLIKGIMHEFGPHFIKQIQPQLMKQAVPTLVKAFHAEFSKFKAQSVTVRASICFEPLPDYFPSTFIRKKLAADKWMKRWLRNEKIFTKLKLKKKGKGRGGTNLPKHLTHAEVLIWPSIWPPESNSLASSKFLKFQAGSRGNKFIRCLPTSVDFHSDFLDKLKEEKAIGNISEVHLLNTKEKKI